MIVKKNLPKVLICDDDRNLQLSIKIALSEKFDVQSAYFGEEAITILKKHPVDLVLLDVEMKDRDEGIRTIPRLLEIKPDLAIIMFSGRTDFETVRDALKLGAKDYLSKGASPDELIHVFERVLETRNLKKRNQQAQQELRQLHERVQLIGDSAVIRQLKLQIEKARNAQVPVLILGETGTGKEVVARQLRRELAEGELEPFVAVDCSTIPENLAESLLFGHERGAFTGAESSQIGWFEQANGGTLFLDEVGNLPLEIQVKLLRVVQEKEVLRIGATHPLPLQFRLICATNENLEKAVEEGRFKHDLYQRLHVLELKIPALRNRTDDLAPLLMHFAEVHRGDRDCLTFLPETLATLKTHPWPGNVRELENLVMYLYVMCEGSEVSPLDLPPQFQRPVVATSLHGPSLGFYEAVSEFEKTYLKGAYEQRGGNVSKLATELGMDRSYLHAKLKKYGIHQAKRE